MDSVVVVFESQYVISINWIGNPMNDTVADAVLAIILAAESSPASLKAVDQISPHAALPRKDRLDRILLFLEAQFGDAVTPVEDGVEIRVDEIDSHKAKLDFDTMEVECKWEPLESRVKHIIKRALGVVAPLGRGGVVDEDEDLMAEIDGLTESEGIKLEHENGVMKIEEDE
jgi:cleavage and polyadenylation specificity factor subunit 3